VIYLKKEQKLFAGIKQQYQYLMEQFLEQCMEVIQNRGQRLDVSLPIHHKMSPEGMLREVDKKSARVHAFMEVPNWTEDLKTLDLIKEECRDIVNHALFVGAFCDLLELEVKDESSTHSST